MEVYRRGVKALAEGVGIRATGRLVEADKDTVNQWLPILGRHSQAVMNYFFRNLHLEREACQLDELWTFIYRKEKQLTALEKLAELDGDSWVWIAFSPVCKLVPAWGERTLPHARRLVFRLKSASNGQLPFFTSNELPHYADALLEVHGEQVQPQRKGTRGHFPKPYRVPPPDLCYTVVVKKRAQGRVVEVSTRIVYGSAHQVEAALQASPVSHALNTYGQPKPAKASQRFALQSSAAAKVQLLSSCLICVQYPASTKILTDFFYDTEHRYKLRF